MRYAPGFEYGDSRSKSVCLVLAALLFLPLTTAAQDARSDALFRAQMLAMLYDRMEDNRLSVQGLAKLGRVVCRHDPGLARDIFLTGAARQQKASTRGSLTAWTELLGAAYGCDKPMAAAVAARVRIVAPSPESLEREVRGALEDSADAEDDLREALERVEPAVPYFRDLSVKGQENFVIFLLKLRRKAEDRADQMFFDTIHYLGLHPSGALPPLFVLGNYLYTSPDVLGLPRDKQSTVSPKAMGDLQVYDLRAGRPNSSPDAAWFYLHAVADSMAIPQAGTAGESQRYVLAYQLYPRAAEYSDQLAREYRRFLEASSQQISHDIAALAEERFRAATLAPDSQEGSRLARFHAYWSAHQYDAAREVASDERRSELKERMRQLADFAEIRDSLDGGSIDVALALTRIIEPGIRRALLYLALTAASLDRKEKYRPVEMLRLAAREFDQCPLRLRPVLWLADAQLQAQIQLDDAYLALAQAVKTWNEWDSEVHDELTPGVRASVIGFVERVEADGVARQFWLRLHGVHGYRFADVLPAFAKADAQRVDSIVSGVRSPEPRQEAEIQALAARLESAAR